jgi:membrane protein
MVAREAVLKYLGLNNSVILSLINNFRWVVIILLFFSCISFIYKHAPSVHKKWKLINAGSVVATLLMLLMTFAFSWWVTNFSNYDRLYGSISTILIIMVLIFVNSLILLVGFELNVSIYSLKAQADDKIQLLAEEA